MQGHQGDAADLAGALLAGPGLGVERDEVEEAREAAVGVGLVVLLGGGDHFADVGDHVLGLGRFFALAVVFLKLGMVEDRTHQVSGLGAGEAAQDAPDPGQFLQRAGRAADGQAFEQVVAFEDFAWAHQLVVGELEDQAERALADAAFRSFGHPGKSGAIRAIDHQLEIGEQVFDLGPVIEAEATDDAVGNTASAQAVFKDARLGVGAIEDCEVLPLAVVALHALDRGRYRIALVELVVDREQRERLALGIVGADGLVLAQGVVADHALGGTQDHLGRAIILFEQDFFTVGEIFLERQDVGDVGTAPAVDRLVGIAGRADVAAFAKQADELVLDLVGVLVLVDEQVGKARDPTFAQLGITFEGDDRAHQQIIKVDLILILAQLFVNDVDLLGGGVAIVVGFDLADVDQLVFPAADRPLDLAWVDGLGVKLEDFVSLFVQSELIVFVEDRELIAEAERGQLLLHDAQTGRVERGDPRGLDVQQSMHAILHLARRLVGEGDREDAVGRSALLDDVGDPVGDDAGLARTGTGDHQQRPFNAVDGLALAFVHPLINVDRHQSSTFTAMAGPSSRMWSIKRTPSMKTAAARVQRPSADSASLKSARLITSP